MPVIKDLLLTVLRGNHKHSQAVIDDMNETLDALPDVTSDYAATLREYGKVMTEVRDYLATQIARWEDPRSEGVYSADAEHDRAVAQHQRYPGNPYPTHQRED